MPATNHHLKGVEWLVTFSRERNKEVVSVPLLSCVCMFVCMHGLDALCAYLAIFPFFSDKKLKALALHTTPLTTHLMQTTWTHPFYLLLLLSLQHLLLLLLITHRLLLLDQVIIWNLLLECAKWICMTRNMLLVWIKIIMLSSLQSFVLSSITTAHYNSPSLKLNVLGGFFFLVFF